MKIYKVCEICDLVFDTIEVDGEGIVEIKELCADCALEIGLGNTGNMITNKLWYN